MTEKRMLMSQGERDRLKAVEAEARNRTLQLCGSLFKNWIDSMGFCLVSWIHSLELCGDSALWRSFQPHKREEP